MSYSSSPRLTAFLCSVLAMGIVDSANAEMCKWVDESGCVHYSETCPEGIKSSNVEIQPPPSRMQVEEANKVFVDTQLQEVEQEKTPSATTEPSRFEIDQMTDRCIKARLSLDALSRKAPIYYDKHGQLQAENYQSVRLDRSSRYLNEDAIKRANEHWILVKKDNCTSAVSGSDVKRAVMQKQKEHQKDQCEFWREELEYIERSRGYHRKHLDLKKLFNANCK